MPKEGGELSPVLQRPTKELVEGYVRKFSQRNERPERAIRILFEKFPDNKSFESVLLKSIVINNLYATQIRAIVTAAEHIHALDIDEKVRRGDPEIVDKIDRMTISGKQRNNYSFATKYCSFHNPAAYPIYDSFVDRLLTAYQRQERFTGVGKLDLKNYQTFRQVLSEFRQFYGLEEINLRKLDMFLWGYGKEVFS